MGYVVVIDERFPRGEYNVSASLQTKSSYWEDLHATFDSCE